MANKSKKDALDVELDAARERGRVRRETEPRAKAARYDAANGHIIVELTNECTFIFPAEMAQGLRAADPKLLAEVEVEPQGFALHWERLDADLTIAGLLAGIFGTKYWMSELGRAGGKQTSEAKAAASRANGARGGRPRKQKAA